MNLVTWIGASIIAVIFAAIVISGIRGRKKGCGSGCASCPNAAHCGHRVP